MSVSQTDDGRNDLLQTLRAALQLVARAGALDVLSAAGKLDSDDAAALCRAMRGLLRTDEAEHPEPVAWPGDEVWVWYHIHPVWGAVVGVRLAGGRWTYEIQLPDDRDGCWHEHSTVYPTETACREARARELEAQAQRIREGGDDDGC